ncbi:MAG: NAD(+) synthase [Acidobacteria bacterium]|nr:NAD(+) synthase [Acidobacteriota bacterium]
MQLIRVASVALNQTPLDWDGNRDRIVAALAAAREAEASIVCLPELAITGYGCEDAFLSPGVQRTAQAVLAELLPETRGLITCLGLPVYHRKALYNTACLVADGRPLGLVAKQFLPGDGVHYEPRWFKPWPDGAKGSVTVAGDELPIGDLIFDCGGVVIGFEICEDAWVADRPGADLALAGADIILNPSASHFAFGKQTVRRRYVAESSRAFGVTYVYSNALGNEAGRMIYDGGSLISHNGDLVAAGERFSFADHTLATVVVDLEENRLRQMRTAGYRPRVDVAPLAVEFDYPELAPEVVELTPAAWEEGQDVKEEEFRRAVALGLFDYLRKSGAHGFVVSLSGGADSATVVCLVAEMVELATAELGLEGVAGKLGQIDFGDACEPRQLVGRLLTCVYQATANSSRTTRDAARGVAEALGATFYELDVEPLVAGYRALVEGAIDRELTWESDDVTLQNIQARSRGPSVWMFANLESKLLLATSNRSEAAVGYTTMDGDTCGGLSPIAGIDKAFLRHWLRWHEARVPALAAVNAQQPTAELRPLAEGQTDEGDLMPYPLLDAIEGAAIRDKHTPLEVFLEMRAEFPDYDLRLLAGYVEHFFNLWCRNQWKRERYAPSFHLDDKNLDPKTWCRFPILSGGFSRELRELGAHLDELDGGPGQ